jgi:hypothetical protein
MLVIHSNKHGYLKRFIPTASCGRGYLHFWKDWRHLSFEQAVYKKEKEIPDVQNVHSAQILQ